LAQGVLKYGSLRELTERARVRKRVCDRRNSMAPRRGWKADKVSGYENTLAGSAAAKKLDSEKIQPPDLSALLHELGNLITVLQIGAQNLDRDDSDEHSCQRSLVILREANRQLSVLIETLAQLLER